MDDLKEGVVDGPRAKGRAVRGAREDVGEACCTGLSGGVCLAHWEN